MQMAGEKQAKSGNMMDCWPYEIINEAKNAKIEQILILSAIWTILNGLVIRDV